MNIAEKIARFVAETNYEKIPAQALANAKIAVRDCLGVALAGSREENAKICAQIAREDGATEQATVIGQGFKSSTLHAALANGTAAHALDFDHSFTLMGQPTAPIIPALISLGDALGASGRRILEAYVVGFEITAGLAFSLHDSSHDGWHAPSTVGAFGATAACAKLLGLVAPRIEMALGIVASMASGIVANFGTMTKPLHVGLGARNGVLAARLAQAGYTANPQPFEGGFGFYNTFHKAAPLHPEPWDELGKTYALITEGIRIKPYPCGGLTHQAIDAVLEFRKTPGVTAVMIEAIDVDVTKHTYERIIFRVPQNGIQGKFCMPYLLSRALIDGRVGLNAFTDAAVREPHILQLAEKVQMRLDSNLKASDAGGRPCRVTLRLKNGQSYSREVQHAKGGPEVPLSEEELKAKFTECARQTVSDRNAARALETIARLESLENISQLCELLKGSSRVSATGTVSA